MANKITNTDLHKRIGEIKKELKEQNKMLRSEIGSVGLVIKEVQDNVKDLSRWRDGVQAVEEYKRITGKDLNGNNSNNKIIMEVLKFLGKVIIVIGGLAGIKLAL